MAAAHAVNDRLRELFASARCQRIAPFARHCALNYRSSRFFSFFETESKKKNKNATDLLQWQHSVGSESCFVFAERSERLRAAVKLP